MTQPPLTATSGEQIAREASRYLSVVDTFAALEADPHREKRASAARARAAETPGRRAAGRQRRRLFS